MRNAPERLSVEMPIGAASKRQLAESRDRR